LSYLDVGKVKWFIKNYCQHCTENCPPGSDRFKICILTIILSELDKIVDFMEHVSNYIPSGEEINEA